MCRQQVIFACGHKELKWERNIPCPFKTEGCPEILSVVNAENPCISCRAARPIDPDHQKQFNRELYLTTVHEQGREHERQLFLERVETACQEAKKWDERTVLVQNGVRRGEMAVFAQDNSIDFGFEYVIEVDAEEYGKKKSVPRRLMEWYHQGMLHRRPVFIIKGQKLHIGDMILEGEEPDQDP
ncbi:hypothetical protein ABW21_db0205585 [Orbilia brochopaga]|nr:hypothetical protein ABW21_db0205585 [Drechslerella brochopaga]